MIQLLRNPEGLVRSIAISIVVLLIFGTYQFAYTPNGQLLEANLVEATRLLDEVDTKKSIPAQYQLRRQELRYQLAQKGIKDKDRWLVHSPQDLQQRLQTVLELNSATIEKCEADTSAPEAAASQSNQITAVFQCDLPHLFKILNETDRFPSNVHVNRFELNEAPGPKICRVLLEFHVELSSQKNAGPDQKKKDALLP